MPEPVLVVDDDAVVLDSVRKALRHDDLEIDAVQSAGEALARLAARPYRLVITDLMMPGLDGLALLERIQATGAQPRTIMITGYPTVQSALRARRLGAFEYVTKPFTRQELRSVVVRALRAPQTEGTAQPAAAPPAPAWHIPNHAWARLEPDGSVLVGMAAAYAAAVGEVVSLELPGVGELLEQGRICALVRASDGVQHSLYCPLTGRVTEVNRAVSDGLSRQSQRWLFRLLPSQLEKETPNLVRG